MYVSITVVVLMRAAHATFDVSVAKLALVCSLQMEGGIAIIIRGPIHRWLLFWNQKCSYTGWAASAIAKQSGRREPQHRTVAIAQAGTGHIHAAMPPCSEAQETARHSLLRMPAHAPDGQVLALCDGREGVREGPQAHTCAVRSTAQRRADHPSIQGAHTAPPPSVRLWLNAFAHLEVPEEYSTCGF